MTSSHNSQTHSQEPGWVPAGIAGLASLLLPGLGQLLNREGKRGLAILSSFLLSAGLLTWRVHLLARLETGVLGWFRKALQLRPAFVVLALACITGLWLWAAWDAYRRARPERRQGGQGIYVLIAVIFVILGWQTSQIDLYKLVTEIPDAWSPLSRVIWPWEASITRETLETRAAADILVPCESGPAPAYPEETAGQPYLRAEPTCGDLSSLDENNNVVSGTALILTGRGFEPDTETQILWADPIANEFRMRKEGEYITLMTDAAGEFQIEVIMPYRLMPPSATGLQIHQAIAKQASLTGNVYPSEPLLLSIEKMVETIFMGMMATAIGLIFAVPLSFLAAKNMMSGSSITLMFYYVVRSILNIVRSIEPMIWAIIAVVVVGLGPFAGLIALTLHTVAALGKLYSESIENIDPGPIEAIQATGATKLQTIVYAVVPQVIPPFISFSIYRWDVNVRMSTIIGMVGGGGIGFLLTQYIRLMNYRAAGIAVWFITITVATLDFVSAKIREKYV